MSEVGKKIEEILDNEVSKQVDPLKKQIEDLAAIVNNLPNTSSSSSLPSQSSFSSPSVASGSTPDNIALDVNPSEIKLKEKIPKILRDIKLDTYNLMQQQTQVDITKAKEKLVKTLTKSSQPIALFITDLFNSTKEKRFVGYFRAAFNQESLIGNLPKLHSDLNDLLPKFGLKVVEGRARTMLVLQDKITLGRIDQIDVTDDILTMPLSDYFEHTVISENITIVTCANLLVNYGRGAALTLRDEKMAIAYGKYLLYLTSAVAKIASKYNLESGTNVYRFGGRKTKKQIKNAHKKTHHKRRL
jgi:hypothetical protein